MQKLPEERLAEHNCGSNSWTRINGPFDLLYSEIYSSKHAAIKRETYMKSAAGRKFINKVLRS